MSFKQLPLQLRYRSDENDIIRDFLIPVLSESSSYKRSVGFFSTSSLVGISIGLCELAKKGGRIEVICSPNLSNEDIDAINRGYQSRDEVFVNALERELSNPSNYFEEERLNLIAHLIAMGIMDLKIAFMETDTGINVYHEKIALLEDPEGNKIAFTGSLNESNNAFRDNFESIYVFADWKGESQEESVRQLENDFNKLWTDETNKLKVIPFPNIIIEKLKQYRKNEIDYEIDAKEYSIQELIKPERFFKIPKKIQLRDYQIEAVNNWETQGYKGIFSMSTGSGKSYTALACAVRLADKLNDKLAVFIVCPYIHLVDQWEEDVNEWMGYAIVAHSKSPDKNWGKMLIKAYKRYRNSRKSFICITTNDTFASEKMQNIINKFDFDSEVLLIIDEAHNFGAERLSSILPYNIKYRIGLSATIKRHMDKKGTDKLFDYFGKECIEYTLKQAIEDKALCKYKYYPIIVNLEEDELEEYTELTNKLKHFIIEENGKVKISEDGKLLLFKRSRILARARNKKVMLKTLINDYRDQESILVYCGATTTEDEITGNNTRMIDDITDMLKNDLGMRVHKFTADENLAERQEIKEFFKQGLYQVITAIKCLDEGVNIPSIKTAFIMSSSRNPKEFIQRRGRLLRKSDNKEYAEIYDFITLPRDINNVQYGDFEKDKAIVIGELYRLNEFAKLADNETEAFNTATKIMNAYDIFIDVEDEINRMEEYYE